MSLLLLNEDELRQTINLSEAVTVIEAAFVASAQGQINNPGSFTLALPNVQGVVKVKGTHLNDAPYYVIKIDNQFLNNPTINLPVNSELILVLDAATGFPAAILLDNGYLTHVRTGAVGALATEYLANKHSKIVTMVGCSSQAYAQLKALITLRTVERVIVWCNPPHEADVFARRLVEDHDVDVALESSLAEAVTGGDIIIAATDSREPWLKADWLKPGLHITCLSSSTSRQLQPEVLRKADVLVVDSLEHTDSRGEAYHAITAGAITSGHIHGELSSLIQNTMTGRTRPDQITLADLTGLDWQDTVIATLALDKALFLGLGQRLEPGLEQGRLKQRVSNLP
ncbi:MAG: Delta(1)-pyrroline-2-carboxylate reductase [Anaerolineae bacterium]|nr:Delta(1)-pyrroline-2-carboxylate reductase [Anaerolineae bacterium]